MRTLPVTGWTIMSTKTSLPVQGATPDTNGSVFGVTIGSSLNIRTAGDADLVEVGMSHGAITKTSSNYSIPKLFCQRIRTGKKVTWA